MLHICIAVFVINSLLLYGGLSLKWKFFCEDKDNNEDIQAHVHYLSPYSFLSHSHVILAQRCLLFPYSCRKLPDAQVESFVYD